MWQNVKTYKLGQNLNANWPDEKWFFHIHPSMFIDANLKGKRTTAVIGLIRRIFRPVNIPKVTRTYQLLYLRLKYHM